MRRVNRLRGLLFSCVLSAFVAFAPAAMAQGKGDAVRPEVGKPLQAAQNFVKQRKGREALAEVAKAEAVGNPPPPTTPPEVVRLDVDFDGVVYWNGEMVPNNETLDAKFRGAASQAIQPEFHLRPNKLVTYKYVAHVMASAQRDGITKIGLIGAEQFLDQ